MTRPIQRKPSSYWILSVSEYIPHNPVAARLLTRRPNPRTEFSRGRTERQSRRARPCASSVSRKSFSLRAHFGRDVLANRSNPANGVRIGVRNQPIGAFEADFRQQSLKFREAPRGIVMEDADPRVPPERPRAAPPRSRIQSVASSGGRASRRSGAPGCRRDHRHG
jgi:hypothetical protein